MAEESLPVLSQKDEQGTGDTTGIQQFQMRRTWESRLFSKETGFGS